MDPRVCEMGTYSDQADGGKCKACAKNEYCNFQAVVAGQKCPDGYNCITGTPVVGPNWMKSEKANFHLCDPGHYCDDTKDANPSRQTACTDGTYMIRYGAETVAACVPCPAGFVCSGTGVVTPTPCTAG
jgi:hypothetical protein